MGTDIMIFTDINRYFTFFVYFYGNISENHWYISKISVSTDITDIDISNLVCMMIPLFEYNHRMTPLQLRVVVVELWIYNYDYRSIEI